MPSLKPQSRCRRCRHAYSLHGNGETACQAGGCKGGPGGTRCPGFLPETDDLAALSDPGTPPLPAGSAYAPEAAIRETAAS